MVKNREKPQFLEQIIVSPNPTSEMIRMLIIIRNSIETHVNMMYNWSVMFTVSVITMVKISGLRIESVIWLSIESF